MDNQVVFLKAQHEQIASAFLTRILLFLEKAKSIAQYSIAPDRESLRVMVEGADIELIIRPVKIKEFKSESDVTHSVSAEGRSVAQDEDTIA